MPDQPAAEHPPAYAELREALAEISDLGQALALLAWDERTMMPAAGAAGRAEQIATLVRVRHEQLVADRLWELIEQCSEWAAALPYDAVEASTVRVARRDAERARRVPSELRAELARAASVGETAWVEARRSSDFAAFLPHLERNIDLNRRFAECHQPYEHVYDPLLDEFEPGAGTADVRRLLGELRDGLAPLVAALAERGREIDDSLWRGELPVDRQVRLVERLIAGLPLPPDGWRLDPTVHPFATSIAAGDVRLTTRYDPGDLQIALFSALHEAGHGIYEAGVPAELRRGPLGRPASLGFHESQSRLWENWVGRSRPYLTHHALPALRDEFPGRFDGVDGEQLYRAANRSVPALIRIEADEVTYDLHIVLRFELELALYEGSLEAADLPEAWRERMRDYLDLEVPDDARGVLQDVHWAAGSFGYFPTYSLGNIIAAQLWELAAAELGDLDELIAAGELEALRAWLAEHLHRHGGRFDSPELAERTLGGPPTVGPLVRHLNAKFGELYGI